MIIVNIYEKLVNPYTLPIFILSFILPIGVGLIAVLRTKNQLDFFVGGCSMNVFVVALSAVSSGRSSWLVLGLRGVAIFRE